MNEKYITVSQLNRYLKFKFDGDPNLNNVFLKGEISNFKAHTRGHFYFTIKDEGSRINAVMFASNASKLKFDLEDGMKVLVRGRISVYEATGGYQIYVEELAIDGLGNLYLEYEKLKKKLASEGLFDSAKKKKIPKFPNRIGIITAPTGAAIRDILSTIKRRWPICETILLPSLVQGKEAAPDIVRQIKNAENYDLDLLIVGRGGGRIEDMWCFNDEEVARAIFNCSIPTISAVGHEIDFTIADFVADLRAPTPTGAAEMGVPNQNDFIEFLNQVKMRVYQSGIKIINDRNKKLDSLRNNYILKNPISIYEIKEQKFDTLYEKLNMIMTNRLVIERNNLNLYKDKLSLSIDKNLEKKKNLFTTFINKLEVLNPLLTIKRGYSITKIDNKVVNSIKDIKKSDTLTVEISDGTIISTVSEIKEN